MDISNIQKLALEKIKQNRLEAEKRAEGFLNLALKNNEFKSLYKKYKENKIKYFKDKHEKCDVSKQKQELLELQKELFLKLACLNIKKEDLKPQYLCNQCGDSGYVKGKVCSCYKKEISKLLYRECGINKTKLPSFSTTTFDVHSEKQREVVEKIYEVIEKYIDKLEESKKFVVVITGAVGVGKTHLLECAANEAIKKEKFVFYTTAFNLNNLFLKYHCASVEEKNIILEPILDCDLLCIDDLGCENILKNVTIEYLTMILNERLMAEKKTIITTNLNFDQIINIYDERIFSRLYDKKNSLIIRMEGEDIRLQKNR